MRAWLASRLALWVWLKRRWDTQPTLRSFVFTAVGISIPVIFLFGFNAWLTLVVLGIRLLFAMGFMIVQFVAIFWFISRPRVITVRPTDPKQNTMEDYWGQPELLKSMRQWVEIFRGDKQFRDMGGEPIKGLLLYGKPGTGKTFLARCIAGTTGIALHGIEGSSFRGMFWGMDVLRVLSFVGTARKLANQYGAAIAYIDEVDSIAMSRGAVQGQQPTGAGAGMFGMAGGGALTTLLAQMDGIERETEWLTCQNIARKALRLPPKKQGHVFFMCATNRPDVLDPAFTRAGRIDRRIEVDVPDGPGRREIFSGYLGRVSNRDVDVNALVQNTHGMTPAEIEMAVTRDAVRIARFRGSDAVEQMDIEWALIEQHMGLANPIGDLPEDQRRQIAYHEAGHSVASYHLRKDSRLAFVSVVRRGAALGFMLPVQKESTYAMPLSRLIADIRVALAGDVASELALGERWTGAGSDMEHVRRLVFALAWHGVFGGVMLKEGDMPSEQQAEAQKFVKEQWEKTRDVIRAHWTQVVALSQALMERQELSGNEATRIIEEVVNES